MAESTLPPANAFIRGMRHVYNPLGFSKGYNFVLCAYFIYSAGRFSATDIHLCHTGFLTIGYLFAFTLARLEYLSYYGIFCNPARPPGTGAAPGECYYYLKNPYKIGKLAHLHLGQQRWV